MKNNIYKMKKLLTTMLAAGSCIFAAGAKNIPHHDLLPWMKHQASKVISHAQGKTEGTGAVRIYSDLLTPNGSGGYDSLQKNFYTYNGFDSLKTIRVQMYDATMKMYMDYGLINYTYDASKHRVLQLEQQISGSNLVNLVKDTSAYDSHGNKILDESFYWYNNTWTPYNGTKDAYTYNTNGYITSVTEQYLDQSANWANNYKLDIGRDNSGKITYLVASYDFGSGFLPVDSFQDVQFYNNDYNKFISATIKEDDGAGTYGLYAKITGTFDSKGNPLTQLVEKWYNGSQTWGNNERQTWLYTSNGDRKLYTDESFNVTTWNLTAGSADSISYDKDGNLVRDDHMEYIDSTATWTDKLLTINHYTKTALTEQNASAGITVYPVPFTDELHISNPASNGATVISLYDMAGKMVYQMQTSAAQNITVPVGNLDKGIYSLRILSGTEVSSKLVVKQ